MQPDKVGKEGETKFCEHASERGMLYSSFILLSKKVSQKKGPLKCVLKLRGMFPCGEVGEKQSKERGKNISQNTDNSLFSESIQ